MRIILEKSMPNGSLGKFHTLDEIVVRPGEVVATVTTRPSAEGLVCWQERVALPPLSGEPYGAAIALLVASGGYLGGGTVQDDPTELETLRALKLANLDRLRDERLAGGCSTPHGPIDTDLISRQNVNGCVSMATIAKQDGEPFSMRWRMRDNTYVMLDADQMIAVGVVVGRYVSAVYALSFTTKDAINAAETVEDLSAIDLAALDWPD